jgi:hypothetical protein
MCFLATFRRIRCLIIKLALLLRLQQCRCTVSKVLPRTTIAPWLPIPKRPIVTRQSACDSQMHLPWATSRIKAITSRHHHRLLTQAAERPARHELIFFDQFRSRDILGDPENLAEPRSNLFTHGLAWTVRVLYDVAMLPGIDETSISCLLNALDGIRGPVQQAERFDR